MYERATFWICNKVKLSQTDWRHSSIYS